MKSKIKSYFENLPARKLGLKGKVKVTLIQKLGMGTSNLNYLVKANNKKFVFRLNMDPQDRKKSRQEFESLKLIEKLDIGPKTRILDESKKDFDSTFIINDYIEGIPLTKIKPFLSDKMIRGIARLMGKMHSTKLTPQIKKLKKDIHCFPNYFSYERKELNYAKKHLKGKKLLKILEETLDKVKKETKITKQRKFVYTQGDFCGQNVLFHKNKYHLIDFEDTELTKDTLEIARVFVDFRGVFNKRQEEIFYKEYSKTRKKKITKEMKEEVEMFKKLIRYEVFAWAVKHTLKVKNKAFHKKFIEQNDLEKDIDYTTTVFKRGLKYGPIDRKYKGLDIRKELGL